jgi:hypothetical protein
MTDYDESCNGLYEDSVSGDFDKDWYSWKEYEFKMIHNNRTEARVWKCEMSIEVEPYGCCSACRTENCCACSFDGKKDVYKDVLEPNKDVPFVLNGPISRGFGLEVSEERYSLQKLYRKVLKALGYKVRDADDFKHYSQVKNWQYMPPAGFFMWHTNRYDNMKEPYRIYMISVDKDGESVFKYQLPNGESHEVMDFHGAVRLFKNTYDDPKTGEESFLWHTVYIKNAHRQSLGFEIRPREIVLLLDSCGTCWDDLRQQYQDVYGVPYK